MKRIALLLFVLLINQAFAQQLMLVNNIEGRKKVSLNGQWPILIDPYENGFYDYRLKESDYGHSIRLEPKRIAFKSRI
jgi:beta-glucuronidase